LTGPTRTGRKREREESKVVEHDAYSLGVPLHIRAGVRLGPIEIYIDGPRGY